MLFEFTIKVLVFHPFISHNTISFILDIIKMRLSIEDAPNENDEHMPLAKRLRPSTLAFRKQYKVTSNLLKWKIRRKNGTKNRKSSMTTTENNLPILSNEGESELNLGLLSEEILLLILERVPCLGLINLRRTSKLFHRLCGCDAVWRYRCQIDHGLVCQRSEYSFLYLYKLFYKANMLKLDENFFKPISQLKTSVIVWYLINRDAPCPAVSHLTSSQVKSIWGITENELETMYFRSADEKTEAFPLCHYEWSKVYDVYVRKHATVSEMQAVVLKRCLRNRQALEEHYRLSLHTSRKQKWYWALEDNVFGNQEAFKALTDSMPAVSHTFSLHKITAMYVDGQLKGGFQTVEQYAYFCAQVKSWIAALTSSFWSSRAPELISQDYRDVLELVNIELSSKAEEQPLTTEDFLHSAKRYVKRLENVWHWQCEHGNRFREDHRRTALIRTHQCYRTYLEHGNVQALSEIKVFFERREVLCSWLRDNMWLAALVADLPYHYMRPDPCTCNDMAYLLLNSGPVSHLVRRFLRSGRRNDFDRLTTSLSYLANMRLELLCTKAQYLGHSLVRNTSNHRMWTNPLSRHRHSHGLYIRTNGFQRHSPFTYHRSCRK